MTLYRCALFCLDVTNSKNYVNSKGERPEIGSAIDGKNIVISKTDLTDDKWLFYNDNDIVFNDAKKQIEALKFYDDWIGIIQ